jgi:trk system potassium uptake protein TrkH
LRVIAGATFLLELCGAILLLPTFLATEETVGGAVWKSVFHSVSAFCNAGFALQSDSLVSLARHPFALHVIALLILLGGLGFGVLMGVWELWRRRIRRLTLTDRLVLRSNAWLLALAFGGWILLEWNGALSERGFFDRLHHAWFHAVTLRTAGFNSVDLNHTGPATTFVSLVFMFVGGGPGGTAGGIKVTTAAILMCAVVSVVRGRDDAEVMGRRLPRRTVYRAAAVATISAVGVLGGTLALLMTQNLPFHALLFEAFSAFGTVGLSLDVTTHLDRVGKLVVMMLMFIGRTGPMTMALLFWRPQPTRVRYIEEEVLVG